MTLFLVILLLAHSALFSGLTIGLMSLSTHDVKRKKDLGDTSAAKIYPLRKQGNLLIVTLMVGNVAANAILSVYLGSIAPGLIASIVAITLIAVFGGIIPQAIFSRHAFRLSASFAPLMQFYLYLLYPFCKPMACVLDKLLGEELAVIYSRKELLQILEEHAEDKRSEIKRDEERIARGALTFGDKFVKDIMTPRSVMQTCEASTEINPDNIDKLQKTGFSRIFVTDGSPDKIIGTVHIHALLGSANLGKRMKEICDKPFFIHEDDLLDNALNAFLKTKHHLYGVVNQFEEVVGAVSIEDVIEEITGREIVDEFDQYDDLRAVARKHSTKALNRDDV